MPSFYLSLSKLLRIILSQVSSNSSQQIVSFFRDPKYYPDPEVFDPNRFTDEERRNRHKAVYLSFGEGPRMCIGIKFALAQTKAGLMSIVQNFKITLSPKQKPVIMDNRASIYAARDGLMVNFTPRIKTI